MSQNLAVDSVFFGTRVMVITDGKVYTKNGQEVMTGEVYATRDESIEASAVGTVITFRTSEIFA